MIASREIEQFEELLAKWNRKINLVSSLHDIRTRHVEDSAQLMYYIDKEDIVLDVGSGAGFPALILSILGIKKVIMVESDTRKSIFLKEAAKISSNEIIVFNERIEKLQHQNVNIITSRACASINKLLTLTKNINYSKKILLLKGATHEEELREAQKDWLFDYKLHDSITSTNGCIVEISGVKQKL